MNTGDQPLGGINVKIYYVKMYPIYFFHNFHNYDIFISMGIDTWHFKLDELSVDTVEQGADFAGNFVWNNGDDGNWGFTDFLERSWKKSWKIPGSYGSASRSRELMTWL